jgi:hypothetical protein
VTRIYPLATGLHLRVFELSEMRDLTYNSNGIMEYWNDGKQNT